MPAVEAAPVLHTGSPYPGLRPFEPHEAFLFHGRESHTQELLDRLGNHRFLAVVGTSGSGKSSLVRAGLMPALYRGFLAGAGSRWRIAVMRPGSAPLDSLAEALSKQDVLAKDSAAVRKTIELSSFGLLEAARQAKLEAGESLLIVVDQFEELFRFHRDQRANDGGAEAQLFVASLLEAANAFSPAVYVVLTMRSDFLGDCAQFPGLPEALNQSQYLIPRLTREQRREAIEKPLALVGARMTASLVQRLLYELGDDPDQLPVLQHALNRTWQTWKDEGAKGDIEYGHYEKAGTLQGALRDHAEGLMDGLPEAAVGKVFRCLTTLDKGRAVRRPASFERLLAVAGEGNEGAVRAVVERYADPGNSLVVLSPAGKPEAKTMVDIAHESLLRRWTRLGTWVDEEADSVRWYADAAQDVIRIGRGEAKTWRDPKLANARKFLDQRFWNASWAEWSLKDSKAAFAEVKSFLDRGAADQADEEAEKEAERQAKLLAQQQATEAAQARAAAEREAKEAALAMASAQREAKERALALAESESREKDQARARAQAEQKAREAAQAMAAAAQQAKEKALALAEAEGREKVQAQAREAAERSRKKWLAVGFALAVLLAAVAGLAVLSYRRAEQNQAALVSKTKSEEEAQQKVKDAQAQVEANRTRQAEIERELKGASAAESQKLQEELKKLSDKNASDEKIKQSAESRLRAESEALAQLRQQATAKDKEYAQAVERAANLERDLKSARDEIEKLKAQSTRPAATDPKTAEELRLARLRIDVLEKELREVRVEAVKLPAVTVAAGTAGATRQHSDGLIYVWIPPGKFRMGCSDGEKCDPDNKRHEVTLTSGFWLGQTEVTQRAWKKVMKSDPSGYKGGDNPVERVTWDDAAAYCKAIGGRLPTEAEWEYAARAGSTAARYGPLDEIAWYTANSKQTHEVGKAKPNALGLYDMLGNVWEWVADWYGPYSDKAVADPRGPSSGTLRVLRGGSWLDTPEFVRVSNRYRFVPSDRDVDIGFRCAGEFR